MKKNIISIIRNIIYAVLALTIIGIGYFGFALLYSSIGPPFAGTVNTLPDDKAFVPHITQIDSETYVFLSEPKAGVYRLLNQKTELLFETDSKVTLQAKNQRLFAYGLFFDYAYNPADHGCERNENCTSNNYFNGTYSHWESYDNFSFERPAGMTDNEFVSFYHKNGTSETFVVSCMQDEKNPRFMRTNLTKNWLYDRLTDKTGKDIFRTKKKDRILCCWNSTFAVLNYKSWQIERYDYNLQLQQQIPLHCKKHWSVLNCEICNSKLYVFTEDYAEIAAVVALY